MNRYSPSLLDSLSYSARVALVGSRIWFFSVSLCRPHSPQFQGIAEVHSLADPLGSIAPTDCPQVVLLTCTGTRRLFPPPQPVHRNRELHPSLAGQRVRWVAVILGDTGDDPSSREHDRLDADSRALHDRHSTPAQGMPPLPFAIRPSNNLFPSCL